MTERQKPTVTVLGTGAIGTAAATALLSAGHPVVAWNRTTRRADGVRRAGARVVDSLADAVAASDLALVCLTDHEAVRALLRSLPRAPSRTSRCGVVAVLATGTPEDATAAADLAHERGLGYLDVGVQTSPEDLGSPAATLLYAGPRAAVATHRTALEVLGPVTWVGEDVRAAAVWDLALFGLWYDAQLGLLRALDQVTAAGVPAPEFAAAARRQLAHVVDATEATASQVAEGRYPRGPASLAEHAPVLAQLKEARAGGRLGDGGLAPVVDLVARLVEQGGAELGFTALVDDDLAG